MLITDKNILKNYKRDMHLWVGIPSIEVTRGGKTYLAFYSGGTKEEFGNYCMLFCSDDGKTYDLPIAVCYEDGYRCFDPCLWIDPLGRLWFIWSRCPEDAVYGAICENPDADNPTFGEEFFIGHNVMMNKPIVLSTGEWIFPVAVWNYGVRTLAAKYDSDITPKGSFAYASYDNGKTFKKLGYADVKHRSFDEHMFLEKNDGTLRCFVRTSYGIGAADSFDGGVHWGQDFDTKLGGPSSRFHLRRLESGRVLLINHYDYNGRNNLTAMLSEDDGITFPYRLLLDERQNVSYPDAAVDSEGMIHITYDRERGAFCSRFDDIMNSAREILTAKISEEDIINGTLTNEKSYIKHVAYKLTEYNGDLVNPFNEKERFTDDEYANYLKSTSESEEDIISKVFEAYQINCTNIHNIEAEKLDLLIEKYIETKDLKYLNEIISIVRNGQSKSEFSEKDIVDRICSYVIENLEANYSLEEIADKFHFSTHYIRHIFKKKTGISFSDFKTTQRIKKAKLLLKASDFKIIDIASACGFDSASYFTEIFVKEVGVTPKEYRKNVFE